MIPSPYNFEPDLTDLEYAKLGVLAIRWAHIENILANCLKVMLRLTDEEAIVMVFPLNLEQRLGRMSEIANLTALPFDAPRAFDELRRIMKGIQYVRNNVVHAIVEQHSEKGHIFHLKSKMRSLTKAEILSVEEITNYAAHLSLAVRYALGFSGEKGHDYALPDRPVIPAFLEKLIQFPKEE